MELSKRLLAVASLVTPGSIVADIGTDHAYIPLYLIQEKKAPGAIAMDVNEGPLLRAEEHVRDAGLTEQIRLRRSDGLEQLSLGECDCAVIAGMGGGLMIRILSAHPEITKSLKECILQPQSEIERVRSFLLGGGICVLTGRYGAGRRKVLYDDESQTAIFGKWRSRSKETGTARNCRRKRSME